MSNIKQLVNKILDGKSVRATLLESNSDTGSVIATNIKWDAELDDIISRANDLSPLLVSKILDVPFKTFKSYTYGLKKECITDCCKDDETRYRIVSELFDLPETYSISEYEVNRYSFLSDTVKDMVKEALEAEFDYNFSVVDFDVKK